MEFILVTGFSINVFTLFQLFKNGSRKVQANNIAIAIVTLWVLRFFISYLRTQDYFIPYLFHQYLFLLDGVLLWLYTKSLVGNIRFSFKLALHFAPFLIGVGYVAIGLVLTPMEELLQAYQKAQVEYLSNEPVFSIELLVFSALRSLLLVFYFLMSLKEIRQYNQVLFANFSNIKHLSASWLVTFLRLWVLLLLLPLVIYFLNYLYPLVDRQSASYIVVILLLTFSFLFNLNIINQSYLPAHIKLDNTEDSAVVPEKELDSRFQNLKEIISKEKYYEDENLSLYKLAGYLNLRPVDLTEIIITFMI